MLPICFFFFLMVPDSDILSCLTLLSSYRVGFHNTFLRFSCHSSGFVQQVTCLFARIISIQLNLFDFMMLVNCSSNLFHLVIKYCSVFIYLCLSFLCAICCLIYRLLVINIVLVTSLSVNLVLFSFFSFSLKYLSVSSIISLKKKKNQNSSEKHTLALSILAKEYSNSQYIS